MNTFKDLPPTPKPRRLSFSKLRRISSFKASKSKKEGIRQPTNSPVTPPEDQPPPRKVSKLSQFKTRISGIYSPKSAPSSPTGSDKTPPPVPQIPPGFLLPSSSDTTTKLSARLTFSNPSGSREGITGLTSSNWPRPDSGVAGTEYKTQSDPNASSVTLTQKTPILKINTNIQSPPRSETSSPAQSFYTACGNISPSVTPFMPSEVSITSSDAIYRFSSPSRFWDNVNQRCEMERLKRERMGGERVLSMCEKIRMERFRRKSNEDVENNTEDPKESIKEQRFIFPETANYYDSEDEEDDYENTGSTGFNWIKKLEERYYGLDEKDDEEPDIDEKLGRCDGRCDESDRRFRQDMTYWERIEELRKAVGNAVSDVALRPGDWRKLVD